jgi:ACS family allantoate permease-like MFS transporter
MSLIASNVAGTTKRSTVLGVVLVAYCAGNLSKFIEAQRAQSPDPNPFNLVGPQIFLAREAPVYTTALIVILACFIGALLTLALTWFILARENRRRDAVEASEVRSKPNHPADGDLTDRENIAFRYTL